jgi:hypothetical protein
VSDEHPVDALRKLEPASLKVTLTDGTEKPVPVPKIRNRWARVIQVVDSVSWVRIEALDKSGGVLGVVEDDDQDVEVDDDDGGGRRDMGLAKVLLEVMRTSQKETRLMFEAQQKGQAELIESFGAAIKSLSNSYEQSLQVQRATAIAEAGANAGGNPEVMAMLQLAMAQMFQQQPKLPGGK